MLNARDPQGLAEEPYDLAIVGGGVYGIMLALEAARRKLRPVLVERHDFAGATSANSLRIVHGGLRYLQTLDLPRFFESVAERRWLLRHFPYEHPLAQAAPSVGAMGYGVPGAIGAQLARPDKRVVALAGALQRRVEGLDAALHLPLIIEIARPAGDHDPFGRERCHRSSCPLQPVVPVHVPVGHQVDELRLLAQHAIGRFGPIQGHGHGPA